MSWVICSGNEAEEKEDEVRHSKDVCQLFVDDVLSVGHLLLSVSPESVPSNNVLQSNTSGKTHSVTWETQIYLKGADIVVLPSPKSFSTTKQTEFLKIWV